MPTKAETLNDAFQNAISADAAYALLARLRRSGRRRTAVSTDPAVSTERGED